MELSCLNVKTLTIQNLVVAIALAAHVYALSTVAFHFALNP